VGRLLLGPDRQRPLIAGDGLLQLSLALQGTAEVEVGQSVVRFPADGLAVGGDGLVQKAFRLQRGAEATVQGGVFRVEFDRIAVGGDGFVQLPLYQNVNGVQLVARRTASDAPIRTVSPSSPILRREAAGGCGTGFVSARAMDQSALENSFDDVVAGSAALHSSMRDLTQPSMARPELAGRVRLVLLAGAALIPVALILLDILRGKPEHHFVLASTAGALIVLVTLRLSGLMVDIAEHHRVQLELEQEIAVRQAAEGRLQQQTEALQRSNAELEQFAYVASHDLQEPLRMVASYAGLLKRRYAGKLDAEADEFIDYAMDGVTRMRALINDLLTYSRVGREERPAESTDSRVALDRALANLEAAIADRQALVAIGNLPTVMASSLQLTQVFQNLIGNGLKFCRETRPEIRVDAERRGAEWIFAVRDNGIGIDPQYKDRIFLIFQRLHKRDEYEGTGIGLAICKKIVERQGGRIWIESEPGKGATFRFTLRAMHALAAAA